MNRLLIGMSLAGLLLAGLLVRNQVQAQGTKDSTGWVQLFNGKDLTGWKTHEKSPGDWKVIDGVIVGVGTKENSPSHLFSDRDDYENFHYRVEAKISDKGNSGQYFRTQFGPGYPKGYEAQINSSHTDPKRTGTLYPAFKKMPKEEAEKLVITDMLVPPDTWFTQEVIANGKHIQIFVNGKKTIDYVDEDNTFSKGHFALQGHSPIKDGPDSVIMVKKVEVKELPASK